MSHMFSDIRLVNGDFNKISSAISNYLQSVNFKINSNNRSQSRLKIEGSNQQQSVIKLFTTSSPQIVNYSLVKKSDNSVQIEMKFDLFRKFRIFYYSFWSILSISWIALLKIDKAYYSNTSSHTYSSSMFLFTGIIFILLTMIFHIKLFGFSKYSSFITNFYADLSKYGFANEISLKNKGVFPDFWQGIIIIILPLPVYSIYLGNSVLFNISTLFSFRNIALLGVLLFAGSYSMYMFVLSKKQEASERFFFSHISNSVCMLLVVYASIPAIFYSAGDTLQVSDHMLNQAYTKTIELQLTKDDSKESMARFLKFQNAKNRLTIVIFTVVLLISFALIMLIESCISTPIKVVKNYNKFLSNNPDSFYHQSLEPNTSTKFINITIIALWIAMGIPIVSGLYISFSILEKAIFGENYLISSEIGGYFIDSNKTILAITCYPYLSITPINLLHKTIITLYPLPLVSMLLLVIKKNIVSFVKEFLETRTNEGRNHEAEEILNDRMLEICDFAGIDLPTVRVRKSPLINSEVKSFLFLKNKLIISEGAWKAFNDRDAELDAMLAHEVWHLKKHTFKRNLLCILSDYTLFGNGYLALLQNSFQVEYEADDFAIAWLKKNKKPVSALKSLLEERENENGVLKFKQRSKARNNFLNLDMISGEIEYEEFIKSYDASSRLGKIKKNLWLLYDSHFGDKIISYLHPPVSQRIARIESKEN